MYPFEIVILDLESEIETFDRGRVLRTRRFCCTPCMFDSLGVKVLSQPDGGEG